MWGNQKKGRAFISDRNGRLLPSPNSVSARTSCGKINELSSSQRKRIHYLGTAVFTDIKNDNINQRAVSNPSGL